jgi:hypothetical protein
MRRVAKIDQRALRDDIAGRLHGAPRKEPVP